MINHSKQTILGNATFNTFNITNYIRNDDDEDDEDDDEEKGKYDKVCVWKHSLCFLQYICN